MQEPKIQEPEIQEPEIQEPKIQESKIHQSTNYWVIGGTMVAGGIAISLIYFIQRGKPEIQTPTVEMPKQEKDDSFDMNLKNIIYNIWMQIQLLTAHITQQFLVDL
jgi:hypothetical protein